eukprot:5409747-Pyramimonas_sp.AAC.1
MKRTLTQQPLAVISPKPFWLKDMAAIEDTLDKAERGRNRIETFAKTSRALSNHEYWDLASVCEVGKEMLRCSIRSFVRGCADAPVRRTTLSDGTPITVSAKIALELPNGLKVRRGGKQTHEFQ